MRICDKFKDFFYLNFFIDFLSAKKLKISREISYCDLLIALFGENWKMRFREIVTSEI